MSRFIAALVCCLIRRYQFGILPADGNRLAYLDGPLDPYYPHRDFPKLITPQWVGEEGVECVVTLAIDDMREIGQVRGVPAADSRPAEEDRRPGAGQHHDLPGRSG